MNLLLVNLQECQVSAGIFADQFSFNLGAVIGNNEKLSATIDNVIVTSSYNQTVFRNKEARSLATKTTTRWLIVVLLFFFLAFTTPITLIVLTKFTEETVKREGDRGSQG